MKSATITLLCAGLLAGATATAQIQPLSMADAISEALAYDDKLKASHHREKALRDEAVSHRQLPDPSLSVTAMNIPVDDISLKEENMTQLALGISQRFPAGNSRELAAEKSLLQADIAPLERHERQAAIRLSVSHLWLDSFLARRSIALIRDNRYLFEQLVDIATARYSTAVGTARQQDVIRAQLVLTRLDDRLSKLAAAYDRQKALLTQWLPERLHDIAPATTLEQEKPPQIATGSMPDIIARHPRLLALDRQADIAATNAELARQSYRPGWAINASYAHRQDSPDGLPRSDLFSVGVSMDLPLFTGKRQDKKTAAALSRHDATQLDYQQLRKTLLARALKARADIDRYQEQLALYQQRLLPQVEEQAAAALSAYTHDDGDFSDVTQAHIDVLNSKIEALEIHVKQRKAIATLRYYLAGTTQTGDQAYEGIH